MQLTDAELHSAFSHPTWAEKYPPVLTVDQAAELAGVPKATIYAWSSQDHLRDCATKVGKRLRIFRDRFVKFLFTEGKTNVK